MKLVKFSSWWFQWIWYSSIGNVSSIWFNWFFLINDGVSQLPDWRDGFLIQRWPMQTNRNGCHAVRRMETPTGSPSEELQASVRFLADFHVWIDWVGFSQVLNGWLTALSEHLVSFQLTVWSRCDRLHCLMWRAQWLMVSYHSPCWNILLFLVRGRDLWPPRLV